MVATVAMTRVLTMAASSRAGASSRARACVRRARSRAVGVEARATCASRGGRARQTATTWTTTKVMRTRTRAASADVGEGEGEPFVFYKDPSRLAIAAAWLGLGSFAAFGAPSGTAAFDMELVTSLISAPFSGSVNPLFEALFNSLGIVPATYACLLMPGAKDQKPLPAALCIGASFALGFFALGPYLITRAPRPEPVTKSTLGFVTRNVWESKLNAVALTAFAIWLGYYGVSNLSPENIAGFAALFKEQSMLACVSTCDLFVLSLAMSGAIKEDMQRRKVDPSNAVAFASLPVLGPVLWLLTRPALEE